MSEGFFPRGGNFDARSPRVVGKNTALLRILEEQKFATNIPDVVDMNQASRLQRAVEDRFGHLVRAVVKTPVVEASGRHLFNSGRHGYAVMYIPHGVMVQQFARPLTADDYAKMAETAGVEPVAPSVTAYVDTVSDFHIAIGMGLLTVADPNFRPGDKPRVLHTPVNPS